MSGQRKVGPAGMPALCAPLRLSMPNQPKLRHAVPFCTSSEYLYPIEMDFQLATTYTPQGDQPRAIGELVAGLREGEKDQVLLGVTGSGKTFTMAKVIEQVQRPALDPGAQQDAGRAALPRVQAVLPGERGRVLRHLLRLLPARGLHSRRRHVHREGSYSKRGIG